MRVATVNVNGIRAAARRGFDGWLTRSRVDVLLLQEVRARAADIPAGLVEGWSVAAAEADRPGRNGVAVLTRQPPTAVRTGLPGFADDGRWLEAEVAVGDDRLRAVSVYVPKGGVGTPAQDVKTAFCRAMRARMRDLLADGVPTLVAGDLNVAHTRADLRAWKANGAKAGFLPAERDWYGALLSDGWHDVVREQHPGVEGPYSWWSWRGKAFDNDAGWRIDVVLATGSLAARVTDARVDRAPSYPERMSDHAPVVVDLGSTPVRRGV